MASSRLRWLAAAGVALAVVVVVLGAFTRLADAGLGCPDWPGCYGHLGVPAAAEDIAAAEAKFPEAPVEADKAWIEMVHRYFAGSLLLLVLAITVVSFTQRHQGAPFGLSFALLVLICCQAAFGAWTVTLKLWPQVVTAHLLGGFATLSMLWVLYTKLAASQFILPSVWANISGHARLALFVVIAQIALGGWVSSNYAALACHDFPTCHGSWWPEMDMEEGFNLAQDVGPNYLGGQLESDARVAIHWVHRVGALVVLFVVAALAWRMRRTNSGLAFGMLGVLATQLTLGILNVIWVLPLTVATLHNAVGALLLLVMVTVNFAPRKDHAY